MRWTLPLQPESAATAPSETTRRRQRLSRVRRALLRSSRTVKRARTGQAKTGTRRPAAALATGAVWMVRVDVAEVLPGVTVDWEKVAVAPGGSPVAVRVMGGMVAPFCAITVREKTAR